MITALKPWKGSLVINGQEFESVESAISAFKPDNGKISIKLYPQGQTRQNGQNTKPTDNVSEHQEYRITVKKYMTEKTEPGSGFDFMAKWNNDNPMPLRTMTGWIEKETKGMLYMHLHGDIWAQKISTCMCCGRMLTNPVSQYFGIGPECGGHHYVNPFDSEEELKEAVAEYKKKLQAMTWTGWVIKSAITEQVEA